MDQSRAVKEIILPFISLYVGSLAIMCTLVGYYERFEKLLLVGLLLSALAITPAVYVLFDRTISVWNRKSIYWKTVLAIFITVFIFIVTIVSIMYFIQGIFLSTASLVICLAILWMLQKKYFLTPSSIHLQVSVHKYWKAAGDVHRQGIITWLRSIIRRRPLLGTLPPLIIGLLGLLNSQFSILRYSIFRSTDESASALIRSIWQVHATTTGFSFIVLIFFWESLRDRFDTRVLIRTLSSYSYTFHIIGFLLSANISIGSLALWAQRSPQSNFLFLSMVLFVSSIIGIYTLYRTVYQYMTDDPLSPFVKRKLVENVESIMASSAQDPWINVVNQGLPTDYPQYTLPSWNTTSTNITGAEVELSGTITDINQKHLRRLFAVVDEADTNITRLPIYYNNYEPPDKVFSCEGDLAKSTVDEIKGILSDTYKVSK